MVRRSTTVRYFDYNLPVDLLRERRGAARWRRCSWRWGAQGKGAGRAPLARHDAPPDELGGARRLNGERTGGLATILMRDLVACAEVSTVMVMVNNRIDLKPSLRLDLARISCDALLYILYRSDIIS